ncbi:hypothetical protein [Pararhodospirillum photometricum]|uniref:hypothetical protein n=1 Tax=Pararhodospirillum photometricum TaxID=1084 RepID=UPI0006872C5F|nr:hypothetical protein [Pararhodospirillum photometricum]
MDVENNPSVPAPVVREAKPSGYRLEGDKVINDEFLDGFTFWDLLDVVNPLQHIPLVSTVYRHLTHDDLKAGPRLAGGMLFGGPLGLAASAFNVVMEKASGRDLGDHVWVAVLGDDTAPASLPTGPEASSPALASGEGAAEGPVSLIPAAWATPLESAAPQRAPTPGASPAASTVTARGAAPMSRPLGYDALTPPNAGTPAAAPSPASGSGTGTTPPLVDVILSSQQGAPQQGTPGSPSSGTPPLGYDALGRMAAPAASQQTSALPTALNKSARQRDPKAIQGMSLAQYQNRVGRAETAYPLPERGASTAATPLAFASTAAMIAAPAAAPAAGVSQPAPPPSGPPSGISNRQLLQMRLDGMQAKAAGVLSVSVAASGGARPGGDGSPSPPQARATRAAAMLSGRSRPKQRW